MIWIAVYGAVQDITYGVPLISGTLHGQDRLVCIPDFPQDVRVRCDDDPASRGGDFEGLARRSTLTIRSSFSLVSQWTL